MLKVKVHVIFPLASYVLFLGQKFVFLKKLKIAGRNRFEQSLIEFSMLKTSETSC